MILNLSKYNLSNHSSFGFKIKAMKPISYIFAFFMLIGMTSFGQQYDDLYFNSNDRKKLEQENKRDNTVEQNYTNSDNSGNTTYNDYSENHYYSDNNDGYSQQDYSYMNNNYYGVDDYYYTQSLNRFYTPFYGGGYNNLFYNPYALYSPWNIYNGGGLILVGILPLAGM